MDTTSRGTPATERSASGPLTAAIALGVAGIGLVFALESGFYGHWYAIFRVVHVIGAVIWVGGGLLLTVLALRAERARNDEELVGVARQAVFAGEKIFAPTGLVVFLMGIAMMINTDWGWGEFWIDAALVGYALTFTVGIAVLSPLAKKAVVLADEQGPTAPATLAVTRRILLIARFDVAILLLVVADMVTKPFA